MKISAWVFLTDLVPKKKNIVDILVKKDIFIQSGYQKVFSTLRNSGVDGIELLIPAAVSDNELKSAKKILEGNSIDVLSIHQPLDLIFTTSLEVIENLFQIANFFSAKVIVLHISATGKKIFNTDYIKTLHDLEKKYHIKIGFENSQKYLLTFYKPYAWNPDAFSRLMYEANFLITLDVAHLGQVGGDIIDFYRKHKDRIINIHISDYADHAFSSSIRPFELIHLPVGNGKLPLTGFLKELKRNSYDGLLTMEINSDLTELCQSAKIIQKYVK